MLLEWSLVKVVWRWRGAEVFQVRVVDQLVSECTWLAKVAAAHCRGATPSLWQLKA